MKQEIIGQWERGGKGRLSMTEIPLFVGFSLKGCQAQTTSQPFRGADSRTAANDRNVGPFECEECEERANTPPARESGEAASQGKSGTME